MNVYGGRWNNSGTTYVSGWAAGRTDLAIVSANVAHYTANTRGTLNQTNGLFECAKTVRVANGPSRGWLNLSGGQFVVTNAATNGAVHIGAMWSTAGTLTTPGEGTLHLMGGNLVTDRLVATNGAPYSTILFDSGTITVGAADIDTDSVLEIGDGTNAAAFNLLDGGTNTFADGLSISSNGTLAAGGPAAVGSATVDGALAMLDGGALQVNLASAVSADLIHVTGNVTLGGLVEAVTLGGYEPLGNTTWLVLTTDGTITGTSVSSDPGYGTFVVGGNQLWLLRRPKGTLISVR